MNTAGINLINCIFCWSIVALAVCGYLLTLKRKKEKWPFWFVLAVGWGFLAIFETLRINDVPLNSLQITTAWLTSYLLVMTSLLLLFLKFVQIKARK